MLLRRFLQLNTDLSRRRLFDLVLHGKISLNDQVVEDFSCSVVSGDRVVVRKKYGSTIDLVVGNIQKPSSQVVVFYKPRGVVVSKSDPHNKTIFSLLPSDWNQKYYYVGRLDKDSHGLLLLVQDPSLVDAFEHPSQCLEKEYRVEIIGHINDADIDAMKRGLWVDREGEVDEKGDFLAGKVVVLSSTKRGSLLTVILQAGKNRHIRRLMKAFGYRVLDLKRISFGPYCLDSLHPGQYRFEDLHDV